MSATTIGGWGCIALPIIDRDGDTLAVIQLAGVEAAVVPGPGETTLSGLSGGREQSKDSNFGSEHFERGGRERGGE